VDKLPEQYSFLRQQPLPPIMVRLALEMLGTIEGAGDKDNPLIIGWADEIAHVCKRPYDRWAADFYNKDEIPWCGLFVGVAATRASQGRAERFPPNKYLSALAWADWGETVDADDIQVGDVVVLVRNGGGHVFIAVGTSPDGQSIMGIGGNQTNAVTLAEFDAHRLYAVRRPRYQVKPEGARRIALTKTGVMMTAEV